MRLGAKIARTLCGYATAHNGAEFLTKGQRATPVAEMTGFVRFAIHQGTLEAPSRMWAASTAVTTSSPSWSEQSLPERGLCKRHQVQRFDRGVHQQQAFAIRKGAESAHNCNARTPGTCTTACAATVASDIGVALKALVVATGRNQSRHGRACRARAQIRILTSFQPINHQQRTLVAPATGNGHGHGHDSFGGALFRDMQCESLAPKASSPCPCSRPRLVSADLYEH